MEKFFLTQIIYIQAWFKGYYNEKLIDLIGVKPRLANTKISQDFLI